MKHQRSGARAPFRPALMALAACTAFGGAARAQDDTRFYIAPMGSYVLSDDDRHADDGVAGTLAFGARLSRSAEIELRGTFLKYKGEDGAKTDIAGGGFGANLFLAGPGGPYLHLDAMAGDETLINVGLGWDFLFTSGFGLRAEALYHTQSNDSADAHDEYKEPLFNLGLRIPFGAAPVALPPPAPTPVTVVPVAPPPPPVCGDGLDNDGDGRVDFPADKGCESADDGDETDPAPPPCAPPEAGARLSLEGCGVGDVIVLRGVNFEFDKATLTVNAKTLLDGVADALEARADIAVELGGHTDGKGSDSYNEKLSDRRAAAVKTYLVQRGIDATRVSTRGYGESQPVASNDTDEGRELNRRVELKVTASSGGGVTVAAPEVPAADALTPQSAPAAVASTVTIADFAFSPASLTVSVGSTVTWINQDGSNHFVTFSDAGSERLKKGATYARTFDAPGVYPYRCTLHDSMKGTVIVQ